MRQSPIVIAASISCLLLSAAMPQIASAATRCSATTLTGCGSGESARVWECWQAEITSSSSYANAYRDLTVSVTWRHESGATLTGFAAWNGKTAGGKDKYVLRTAFSKPGIWNWTSTCTGSSGPACSGDLGLSRSSPSPNIVVSAQPAGQTNPLYRLGFLNQLRLRKCLAVPPYTCSSTVFLPIRQGGDGLSAGTPFFWNGDTAWAATMRSCPDEWISYLNSRKSQKFNVVHLGLAPRWLGGCNQFGETPFSDQSSCAPPVQDGNLDCADPNGGLPMAPDAYPTGSSTPRISYWERLDKMVQTANSQGLVVFIAGVAKPVQDNPGIAAAVPFARFLAARLAGNFVVMSPGFDDKLDAANLELIRAVGAAIAAAAPRMIVTNHSGTHPVGDLAALHSEPWLGFQMFQSGYFGGEPGTECNDLEAITQRPVTMPQALRNYPPTIPGFSDPSKPAINGEAAYEEGGEVGNPAIGFEDGDHRNRYRAR